jgi:hypothetical protein
MVDSLSLADGRITFLHGHKIQDVQGLRIFGHEHPVIRFRDSVGAQVTMPCFLHDEMNNFLVMPAFSPLASGTNVLSPETSFMNPVLRTLDMSEARVFAIHDGIMDFGKVADLRKTQEEGNLDILKDRNRRS